MILSHPIFMGPDWASHSRRSVQMNTSGGLGECLGVFCLISFPGDSPAQLGGEPLDEVFEVPPTPLILESVKQPGYRGHPGLCPAASKLPDCQAGCPA